MPRKKKHIRVPKEEGFVSSADGKSFAEMDTSEFEGKTVSFDAHDITSKIMRFGEVLTGVNLYSYQKEAAYAIIYSVITFSGDVKTMLFSRQSGKCFDPETKVRMADMSVKSIRDIREGDYVMGVGGVPRKVIATDEGIDQMYEVHQRTNYGKSYLVNSRHIMAFKERLKTGGYKERTLGVQEYLKEPKWKQKDAFVGYRSKVDFNFATTTIDPYFLGIWLGYGRADSLTITTMDSEVISYIKEYADKLGMNMTEYYNKGKAQIYAITKKSGKSNILLDHLREYNLINNKHIPIEYLHNSREVRLQLLAGLIDSDGYNYKGAAKANVAEITFANKTLAEDVRTLILSLGIRCSITKKRASIKDTGYEGEAYRLYLYGELWEIPTKVERKKFAKGTLREDPLNYGFDIVKSKVGKYKGIQVDGDNLFLLEDFSVVHNTEAIAFVIDTLCVLLPALAKMIPDLEQFKNGFHVGLFAPQSDQVQTTYSRALTRLKSANAEMVMADPDLDVDLESDVRLELTNGSFLAGQVASKQSKIESKTYDLVIEEEAQDIDDLISSKSIEPMLSSTGGSLIKVGTTGMFKNHFWYEIQHNRNTDRKVADKRIRNHFEFDYRYIIKARREQYEKDHKRFHLNYEADVKRKIERWGKDSQAFKLAYALIWDLETGMVITDKQFDALLNKRIGFQDPAETDYIVAGIDIGKSPASTIITIGRVFNDENNIYDKPYKQILAWVDLGGLDYEAQHHIILDTIVEYNIQKIFIDYTGVGKPVVDRLIYACGDYVDINPYTFTSQSKSDMWYNFTSDITTKRIIVPANRQARNSTEFGKFEEQLKNCQKYYNGAFLVCEKSEGYFDDYVDSCALMCLAANQEEEVEQTDIEVLDNPLYTGITDTINSIKRNSWR